MYKADMLPYDLWLESELENVRCVGWLNPNHPYSHGTVPGEIAERLLRWSTYPDYSYIDGRINRMRGVYWCKFCDAEILVDIGRPRPYLLGSNEVLIPCDGGYFCSPDLVYHYIMEHRYCPPEEFFRAVSELSFDKPFNGGEVFDQIGGLNRHIKQ